MSALCTTAVYEDPGLLESRVVFIAMATAICNLGSTEPGIPPTSLNRVSASAGVKAGMFSLLMGGR